MAKKRPEEHRCSIQIEEIFDTQIFEQPYRECYGKYDESKREQKTEGYGNYLIRNL